jgi:Trypsin-like peptidase domain
MKWGEAIDTIRPHVVKIETPRGHGTGFLAFYNTDRTWCGIATAAHVVEHADEWQEPMRLRIADAVAPLFLTPDQRVIFLDRPNDSAVVLFLKREFELPEVPIGLIPVDEPCHVGTDIGWLGFPAIEPNSLCFFGGTVSAVLAGRKSYLVDGVAIHGVSGGPVFHCPTPGEVQIIGCVSAYHANRVTGDSLPGLLRAQDVSHFHEVTGWIRNIDEANAKKREFEAAQKSAVPVEAVSVPVTDSEPAIPPQEIEETPPNISLTD